MSQWLGKGNRGLRLFYAWRQPFFIGAGSLY
jgi:hypothetical protein